MKKKSLIFSIVAIYSLNIILAQAPAIEWQNTIGGNDWDQLFSIQQTTDGGYILGGHSTSGISGDKTEGSQGGWDYWVVKLDLNGVISWQNTIGGSNDEVLYLIQQTTDGGYILGGSSNSGISGDKTEICQGGTDYWVVKLDANGVISWQNTIGGTSDDNLLSIQQTEDGGYILGGASLSSITGDKSEVNYGSSDYWVVKLDGTGQTIEWQKTIGGRNGDYLFSIQQTEDNGYILGGYSESGISGNKTEVNQGDDDYWVVKLNANGVISWQNTIGGVEEDKLFSVQQTIDGGYILGGYSLSGTTGDKTEASYGNSDYWVVKLDANGVISWQNTIGGTSDDYLYSTKQIADGGYFLGGYSKSGISGDKIEGNYGPTDYWVLKLDGTGQTIEWQNTIGGDRQDVLRSVQQTTGGGYILGGYSDSDAAGDKTEARIGSTGNDLWVVKLASSPVTISGYVRDGVNNPIEGVAVAFSNGGATVTTNTTGYYITSVTNGWSGTSTATKNNWTFTPLSYTYPAVTTDLTNQNYTGTYVPSSVTISGYVKDGINIGIEGVAVAFSNGGAIVTTNATGHYSTSVTNGWSGTSTATKNNWTFDPTSYTYPVINTNQTNQDYQGTDLTLVINEIFNSLPTDFTVLPAYPNPFNPSTTIRYGIPTLETRYALSVLIQIYDITGQLITTLQNGYQSQGWHSVEWNGTNNQGTQVPAGLYFSRIVAGNDVKTTKLMLLK